jgi:hypothetical protein
VVVLSQVWWWYLLLIPALEILRLEDQEFKTSLGYIVRP